ncbi:MAG: hypothetical protein Q7S84_04235 [bacterium]|nr:hypothetical protein [bacterium]
MNLSNITFELLSERYEEIPERFRELLESPGTKTTLVRIGAQHALDHERQTLLEALVGLVFTGFLSPDDLAGEFVDRLFLNFVHARALAREVDETFFAPHRRDLVRVYNPVGGVPQGPTVRSAERPMIGLPSQVGKTISLESIGASGGREQKLPINEVAAPLVILGSSSPTLRKPIIPNRPPERLFASQAGLPTHPTELSGRAGQTVSEKPVYHSPFSFRFPFRSPQAARTPLGDSTGPTATVRLPGSAAPAQKKDGLHIVHYAETRGRLGPPLSTGKGGVVNLDQLGAQQRKETREKGQETPIAPTTDNRQPTTIPKPQPKIDGNTIDLRANKL